MTKTSFAEKLTRLRGLFLAQMAEDVPQLVELTARLQTQWHTQSAPDPDTLQSLRMVLHRIKGTAGTFEYHALAEPARELEAQVKHWLTLPSLAAIDAAAMTQFQHRMTDLVNQNEQLQTAAARPSDSAL